MHGIPHTSESVPGFTCMPQYFPDRGHEDKAKHSSTKGSWFYGVVVGHRLGVVSSRTSLEKQLCDIPNAQYFEAYTWERAEQLWHELYCQSQLGSNADSGLASTEPSSPSSLTASLSAESISTVLVAPPLPPGFTPPPLAAAVFGATPIWTWRSSAPLPDFLAVSPHDTCQPRTSLSHNNMFQLSHSEAKSAIPCDGEVCEHVPSALTPDSVNNNSAWPLIDISDDEEEEDGPPPLLDVSSDSESDSGKPSAPEKQRFSTPGAKLAARVSNASELLVAVDGNNSLRRVSQILEAHPEQQLVYGVSGHNRIFHSRERALETFKKTPGAELFFTLDEGALLAFIEEEAARMRRDK